MEPSEILVVDAWSSDKTESITRGFPGVTFIRQKSKGIPGAWNEALSRISSDYIAILDSDDFWELSFLRDCLNALGQDPSALLAFGKVTFFVEDEQIPAGFRSELIGGERIGYMPGSTLFKREIFERVGTFPEDLIIASDIEWFARVKDLGISFVEVPQLGLNKRMHGGNASLDPHIVLTYQREVLDIARRRIKSSETGGF